MRGARLLLMGALTAGITLACTGGDKGDPPPDSDDATGDSPPGNENSDDTSFGDDFDEESPSFSVSLEGANWSTDEGVWFSNNLSASIPDASQSENINLTVDGELKWAGTYTVTDLSYSLTPAQAAPIIYNMTSGSVTVTVLGFSGDNENLFGTIDGSATLSDGSTDIAFEGGEIRNWGGF
ncbi:MAG: hypothetical protein GY913_25140 [Proteobacteria bacterium]|nr:hypothetical protein [Pseudomonadota bacterium]MCP4920199.1 hypothetical protein [Pseudomonadota bacterium]